MVRLDGFASYGSKEKIFLFSPREALESKKVRTCRWVCFMVRPGYVCAFDQKKCLQANLSHMCFSGLLTRKTKWQINLMHSSPQWALPAGDMKQGQYGRQLLTIKGSMDNLLVQCKHENILLTECIFFFFSPVNGKGLLGSQITFSLARRFS